MFVNPKIVQYLLERKRAFNILCIYVQIRNHKAPTFQHISFYKSLLSLTLKQFFS